eukprot:8612540-Lingulodinium_polyedra.AAC.1
MMLAPVSPHHCCSHQLAITLYSARAVDMLSPPCMPGSSWASSRGKLEERLLRKTGRATSTRP